MVFVIYRRYCFNDEIRAIMKYKLELWRECKNVMECKFNERR